MFRLQIVDHPDRRRKLHSVATPLGGGIGVLLGIILAVSFVALLGVANAVSVAVDAKFLVSLGSSATFLLIVGLVDDRIGIRGRRRRDGGPSGASGATTRGAGVQAV